MAFEPIPVARFIHIVLAAFWVGGDVYFFLLVNPVMKKAGSAAESFGLTLLRRGGFGKILFPISTATILAGAFLYYELGYHRDPFLNASTTVLTIGALLAIAAYLAGLFYFLPRERALVRLAREIGAKGPTAEQSKRFQEIGAAMETPSKIVVGVLGLAFVLMVGRTLV